MSPRSLGIVAAAGIALVLAQDVDPAWSGFHEWPYATALGLVAALVLGGVRRAGSGAVLALLGTLVILAAGLGSGLLGPDTETVVRAPGTVAPLPDAGAAAFFPNVTADGVARGDARVTLRRLNAPDFDLGLGERRYLGATALGLEPRLAAYIEARDASGRHLTITQPTNPAFLSPIVLFSERVAISGRTLPADSFATPALRRQIKVFYFSKTDSRAGAMHGVAGSASLLFAVDDDAGRSVPGGIGFVKDGGSETIGGVRLSGTIGAYPALVISSVPYEPALIAGAIFVFFGLALGWYESRKSELRHTPQKA